MIPHFSRRAPRACFDFDVLDETEEWLVVNKPAPLQIHPSKPKDAGLTLWDGLREMLSYELVNGGQVSIINRLDRETSGAVLIAKTARAARRFGKAMLRRQIGKAYLSVVHGWPEWQEKTVDAPILRAGEVEESRIWVKQIVHEKGAACTSVFRVLDRWASPMGGDLALIEATPLTGRMHQLRVHLAHTGHSVVGDKLYGADDENYLRFMSHGWTPEISQALFLPRQALHSHHLEVNDEYGSLAWTAPLPGDMEALRQDR